MVYEASSQLQPNWKSIYDVVSACGKASDPKSFAIDLLDQIKTLCPFDQALVFFYDGNNKLCGQHLVNVDESWSAMYFGYYINSDARKYNAFADRRERPDKITMSVYDWEHEASKDFVQNYIRPMGIKSTCGFALYDLNGNYRMAIALDRSGKGGFTQEELLNLSYAIPQLNHLHKNFYYQGFTMNDIKHATWETASLTGREVQIADLLCMGVSPANISRTLHIAQSTTYKHIAHIYEKMHVSSQQELLVRLLGQLQ